MGFYAVSTKAVEMVAAPATDCCSLRSGSDKKKTSPLIRRHIIPINCLPPYNCSTHSGRHTFWHLPWFSRLVGHCSDIYPLRLRGREKSAWVCRLSNGKSRNGQSQHSSNICEHEPSLLRWDSNREFNPPRCCWSKQVNRAVLSRTPPLSLQQYPPCLTWG